MIERPELTLPQAEAEYFKEQVSLHARILEYGSGGSTVIAAEAEGKSIFSVENDKAWADKMAQWFSENPTPSHPVLHHVDLGPTKGFAHPKDDTHFRSWPNYPLSVWARPDFFEPDMIFIDGRFRVACFLTAMFKVQRRTTVLFDDYLDRPQYHFVETFFKPTAVAGRLARFEIEPTQFPVDRMDQILRYYVDPA